MVSFAAAVFKPGENIAGPLTCRTCHQEHDGKERDIAKMTNTRCQACHRSPFASLATGHPEFGTYPFDRRTSIIFDHVSHIGKHFKDTKVATIAPQECRDCHAVDVSGLYMEIKGFDATCARCHAGQIEGEGRAGTKGTPVLSVPGLDLDTLRDLGVPIGAWPEDAEGEITPFMDFLLAGDKKYEAARAALVNVDLFDLEDADGARLEAVKIVAWAVKGLLADMEVGGMAGVKARLEKTLGHPLTREDLTGLTGLLSVDALRAAHQL